jgi:trans-aconitate methyltransferase
MQIREAVDLIGNGFTDTDGAQVWADLGCGKGVFTHALATVLQEGSVIHAVDRVKQKIGPLPEGRVVHFHQLDFDGTTLPFRNLDGVLMANSFHFVKDKVKCLTRLKQHLVSTGNLLIVEYELHTASQWVPYPIPFESLQDLLAREGFKNVYRIGERKSLYGAHMMYAAIAKLVS